MEDNFSRSCPTGLQSFSLLPTPPVSSPQHMARTHLVLSSVEIGINQSGQSQRSEDLASFLSSLLTSPVPFLHPPTHPPSYLGPLPLSLSTCGHRGLCSPLSPLSCRTFQGFNSVLLLHPLHFWLQGGGWGLNPLPCHTPFPFYFLF